MGWKILSELEDVTKVWSIMNMFEGISVRRCVYPNTTIYTTSIPGSSEVSQCYYKRHHPYAPTMQNQFALLENQRTSRTRHVQESLPATPRPVKVTMTPSQRTPLLLPLSSVRTSIPKPTSTNVSIPSTATLLLPLLTRAAYTPRRAR